jgi:hypothetical protein
MVARPQPNSAVIDVSSSPFTDSTAGDDTVMPINAATAIAACDLAIWAIPLLWRQPLPLRLLVGRVVSTPFIPQFMQMHKTVLKIFYAFAKDDFMQLQKARNRRCTDSERRTPTWRR